MVKKKLVIHGTVTVVIGLYITYRTTITSSVGKLDHLMILLSVVTIEIVNTI